MDGSDKGFSSSTTVKPSAIPKFSGTDAEGSDENDQSYHKMNSNLHNPLQKPPMTKHFMSPTISASSKAITPRKKILAERNESSNLADTNLHNTPNLDSEASPLTLGIGNLDRSTYRVTTLYHRVSDSGDDEQINLASDSSSKPYDPSTNYLSPRPKFLRYKPNRRREIFLGQKNEIGKEKDGSDVRRSVSADSQIKAIDKADSSVNAHSSSSPSSQEGSVEQEEEEINIMRENDQNADADEEIEEFEKESCLSLKSLLKFLLVFVILFFSTIYICSMNSPTPSQALWGFKDGYQNIHNQTFEVANFKNFKGRSGPFVQREETQYSSDKGFEEEVTTEENKKGLVENDDEAEEEDVSDQWLGTGTAHDENVYDDEMEKKEESCIGFQQEQDAESEGGNGGYEQLIRFEPSEATKKSESLQVEEGEDKIETIEGIFDEGAGKEVAENKMEIVEGLTVNSDIEIVMTESSLANGNAEAAANLYRGDVHSIEDTRSRAVIGFLVLPAIVALTVLGFHWRRRKTTVNQSSSMEKPLSESVLAEKISSVGPVLVVAPNVEEERHIEKVESFVNPSSLIRSTEETSKEFYKIQAPTVELLGEFVVGEASSSIKSCTMRSKMMEVEVSSSNSSGFQEKGAHAVSSQVKPSASEFSTMSSYGSFTAEKKIGKKEVVTTPVRRSSRIHNRAVMSP